MKCRRIVKGEDGKMNIVWFGSYGKTGDGKAIFYGGAKHDNYAQDAEAIKCSIMEKMSVLKGEIWAYPRFGLPLVDKVKNKGIIDAYIINIINGTEGVREIKGFVSEIDKNGYSCYSVVETVYGDVVTNV